MRTEICLNGIWNFLFARERSPEPPFRTSDVMPVPGCFDLLEPYCGQRGYAVYVRKVFVGGLVKLSFDGVGLSGRLYFDERFIGELKYPYMPEEFLVETGEYGEHEIALVLTNQFNEVFEPYFDFYGHGGIYGTVMMTVLPQCHLQRLQIETEDYLHGIIRVKAWASDGYSGKAELILDSGQTAEARFVSGGMETVLSVENFRLWHVDSPFLYHLTVKTETDELTESFGIRKIETCGRQILLNGRPLKIIGVNRHESSPMRGASLSLQEIAWDLRMLKNAGFNFIRGSHYPQRKEMLEYCDRLGMLVWEETLGWGFKSDKFKELSFLAGQIEQVEKMTAAHCNHPCIIIRGFLNELDSSCTESREIVRTLVEKIRSLDSGCLITYASNRYEKDVCWDLVDVIAVNPYPGWYDSAFEKNSTIDRIRPRLQELAEFFPKDRPLLVSEIGAEALLGFRDPLQSYWSEEYQSELLQEVCSVVLASPDYAGFTVWQFADTRSYSCGPYIYQRPRGFNNKGMVDEYRRPKLSWNGVSRMIRQYNQEQEE